MRITPCALLVTATALAAAAVAVGPAFSAQTGATTGCGAMAQSIVTADYRAAALTIYDGELGSPEVTDDLDHVKSATDLARAVADDDVAATLAATTRIVYTPVWHIVRLRVLSSSGQVLADVGGPDVLAPVTAKVRYHGKLVGSFVMSVQDDLGYEKLVMRFTGLPIEFYRNGARLMGLDFPASTAPPTLPPEDTPITVNGQKAVTLSYPVLAFPNGHVQVLLAIPAASTALEADSCEAVNVEAYGEISAQVARLFNLRKAANALTYVMLVHEFDPYKLTFVRRDTTQLAGSDGATGPASIPNSGSVSYDGQSWFVYSFVAKHGLHVYDLFPSNGAGSTGLSGPTGAS